MEVLRGCYAIVNRVTGYVYIGSSVDMLKRWREHVKHLKTGKHKNQHLQRSWAKHGRKAFVLRVIKYMSGSTEAELRQQEQRYLNLGYPFCYNINPRADCPPNQKGYKHTPEARAIMSAKSKAAPRTKERYAKVAAKLKGRTYSAETIEAMRRGATGRKATPEQRRARSARQRGKKWSPRAIAQGKARSALKKLNLSPDEYARAAAELKQRYAESKKTSMENTSK